MYMDVLGAYIYSQKNGEACNIWDPVNIINMSLKNNPQVKILKDKPEENASQISMYKSMVSPMKFTDIQKYAFALFQYKSSFTTGVQQILDKASIKSKFDMGIHLVTDSSGTNLPFYADLVKAYQLKSKKTTLNLYVMADSYSTVTAFQKLGNSSWTVVSLSRTPNTNSQFLQTMAEVQIMTSLPSLILNYSQDIDRFIYLMRPIRSELEYFREISGVTWHML